MPSLHIQKNDLVQVISGSGSGSKKQSRVLGVFPEKSKVLVEGINIIKKTVSSKQGQRTKGGIAEQEAPIHVSNVKLICSNCGPTRVGIKVDGDKRYRVCKKCGNAIAPRK